MHFVFDKILGFELILPDIWSCLFCGPGFQFYRGNHCYQHMIWLMIQFVLFTYIVKLRLSFAWNNQYFKATSFVGFIYKRSI